MTLEVSPLAMLGGEVEVQQTISRARQVFEALENLCALRIMALGMEVPSDSDGNLVFLVDSGPALGVLYAEDFAALGDYAEGLDDYKYNLQWSLLFNGDKLIEDAIEIDEKGCPKLVLSSVAINRLLENREGGLN